MCGCTIETLELFLTQKHFGQTSDGHKDRLDVIWMSLDVMVMSFCFLDPLSPWQAQRKNAKNDELSGDNKARKGKLWWDYSAWWFCPSFSVYRLPRSSHLSQVKSVASTWPGFEYNTICPF